MQKPEISTNASDRLAVLQKAVLDNANFSIISTDLKGIIQSFNVAAEMMLGVQSCGDSR